MVYIKYLEQCLKHRTRSINISHPCCYYYLHFMGASVYTCARTQDPARLSGDLSCQLPYCHLQVALTKEATEFCILSFLFFRSPCVRPAAPHPKSHLQAIAFHLPPLLQGLWGKKGRAQAWKEREHPAANEMAAVPREQLFLEQWKPQG